MALGRFHRFMASGLSVLKYPLYAIERNDIQ